MNDELNQLAIWQALFQKHGRYALVSKCQSLIDGHDTSGGTVAMADQIAEMRFQHRELSLSLPRGGGQK